MAKKMTKAEMEAFKKKNFDLTKKVTKSQLDKLRAEKTPEKAIAKYKNDPAMREALNRFYGKARVGNVTVAASSSLPKGKGPGNTRPKSPQGKGPGATRTSAPKKPQAGMGLRATASTKKTLGNIAEVGKPTGMLGNQIAAAKNYKAPKNYKPLSTGQKLGMAASAVPIGKAAMVAGKVAAKGVSKIKAGTKVTSTAKHLKGNPKHRKG